MTVGTGRGARSVRNTALIAFASSMVAFGLGLPGESHLVATFTGPLGATVLLILLVAGAAYVQRKGRREIAVHAGLTLIILAGFSAAVLTSEQFILTVLGATGLFLYGELAYMGLRFGRLQNKIRSKVVKSGAGSRGVLDFDEVEGRVARGLRQPVISALLFVGVGLYAVRPLFGTLSPAIGASLELRSLYGALLGAGSVLVALVLARFVGLRASG